MRREYNKNCRGRNKNIKKGNKIEKGEAVSKTMCAVLKKDGLPSLTI